MYVPPQLYHCTIGSANSQQIYMLSSINHHVAILHLRVHRRYLDIITKGTSDVPPDSPSDSPWHVLKVRRTRWYNLFDAQDRLEVFKGIWTLFHCLLRYIGSPDAPFPPVRGRSPSVADCLIPGMGPISPIDQLLTTG